MGKTEIGQNSKYILLLVVAMPIAILVGIEAFLLPSKPGQIVFGMIHVSHYYAIFLVEAFCVWYCYQKWSGLRKVMLTLAFGQMALLFLGMVIKTFLQPMSWAVMPMGLTVLIIAGLGFACFKANKEK